mgnify:CR=1 FL=1
MLILFIAFLFFVASLFVGPRRSRRVVPHDKPEPPLHPRLVHINGNASILATHLRILRGMSIGLGVTPDQKTTLRQMIDDVSGIMIGHCQLPKAPFGPCRDASVRFINQLNELVTQGSAILSLSILIKPSTAD